MTMRPGSITGVLIARDEERCLGRALASIRDVVDEIVVLDTGSVDDTPRIAREAGARVAFCEWPNDFSIARNNALDLSRTEVNFFLDADEWLVEGGSLDLGAASQRVGVVHVQSLSTADGAPTVVETRLERLLPSSVRYVGAIHEQPSHDLPVYDSGWVLLHDGYEGRQAAAKRGRNEALLRHELSARPSAYLRYQMGKELQAQERWSESAQFYVDALIDATSDEPWRHALVTRSMAVLGKAGRFEEAFALADREARRWAASPDYFFALGNLYLDFGVKHPSRMAGVIPRAEAAWRRCLDIGDRPDLDGSVQGRGSWLAAHNLAALYDATGRHGLSVRLRELACRRQATGGLRFGGSRAEGRTDGG